MIASYLKRTSGLKNASFLFALLILYGILAGLGYWKKDLMGLFAIIAAIPFIFLFAFKPETYLVLFMSFLCMIPAKYHGETYDMFPIYYNKFYALPFATVFLAILYIAVINSKDVSVKEKGEFDITGLLLAVFLVLSVFSAIRGFALDHPLPFIFNQIIPAPLFFTYYGLRKYFRWKKNFLEWIWFLFFLGMVVSVFYYYMTAQIFTDVFSFVVVRAVTHHGQLMIATVPIAASLFFMVQKKSLKVLTIFALLLYFILIFLTQQRILWVVVVFQVVIYPTLLIFRDGINIKNILSWLSLVFTGITILIGLIFLASWYLQTDLGFLLTRWESVQNMQDGSLMMRVYDSKHAIELVNNQWFWGLGMGALLRSVPTGHLGSLFDQSYMFPYFYGGIFLVLAMVGFYISGLVKSFIIFIKVENKNIRLIALAIFTTLAGQMGSGMTDVTMSHFQHLFIWVFLIAMTTVMYENYSKKPKKLKDHPASEPELIKG